MSQEIDESQILLNKLTAMELRKKGGFNEIHAKLVLEASSAFKDVSPARSIVDPYSTTWSKAINIVSGYLRKNKMEKTLSALDNELKSFRSHVSNNDGFYNDKDFDEILKGHKTKIAEASKNSKKKPHSPNEPSYLPVDRKIRPSPAKKQEETPKYAARKEEKQKRVSPVKPLQNLNIIQERDISPIKEDAPRKMERESPVKVNTAPQREKRNIIKTVSPKETRNRRQDNDVADRSRLLGTKPSVAATQGTGHRKLSFTEYADQYLNPPPKKERPTIKWHGKEMIEPELEDFDMDFSDLETSKVSTSTIGSSYNRFGINKKTAEPQKKEKKQLPLPKITKPVDNPPSRPLPRPPKLKKEERRPVTMDGSSYSSNNESGSDFDDENIHSMDELQMLIEGDSGPSTLDSDSIFRSGGPVRRRPSNDQSYRTTKRYKDGSLVRRRKNDPLERISRVYTLDGSSTSGHQSMSLLESYNAHNRPSSSRRYEREESDSERHERHKEERRKKEEEERKKKSSLSSVSRRFLQLNTVDLEEIDQDYHHHSSRDSDHHHHHSSRDYDRHHHSSHSSYGSDDSDHHHHHHGSDSSDHHHHHHDSRDSYHRRW